MVIDNDTITKCPQCKSEKLNLIVRDQNGNIDTDATLKKEENNNVSCPYCGSTNIQLMRKKWSPLTGFLTNKVDRYCVNCKRKF